MAWIAEDRRNAVVEKGTVYLTDDLKIDIANKYFPRYPTKRAVLLPALHTIQHAYGWIPTAALEEIATFLELAPAEVMDTATFYEEYWLRPKGRYLIQVCRSLSCEICQSQRLTEQVQKKLNLEIGETTPDGKFTLVELECLGACGTAPVALINEVLHENLTPESLDIALNALPEDPAEQKDPTITWTEEGH
ncbi:MAG: NADH-quinone oxidoreductase subunit NuoE [Tepidisphaeraceae bacterium]